MDKKEIGKLINKLIKCIKKMPKLNNKMLDKISYEGLIQIADDLHKIVNELDKFISKVLELTLKDSIKKDYKRKNY